LTNHNKLFLLLFEFIKKKYILFLIFFDCAFTERMAGYTIVIAILGYAVKNFYWKLILNFYFNLSFLI